MTYSGKCCNMNKNIRHKTRKQKMRTVGINTTNRQINRHEEDKAKEKADYQLLQIT